MYHPCGQLIVPLKPVTKPSFQHSKKGGGHWGKTGYKKFRKEVHDYLTEVTASMDMDILYEPLDVAITVSCKPPASSKLPFPLGDVDNFSKSILDVCTGVVWVDDWQIRKETISKEWSTTGEDSFTLQWKVVDEYKDFFVFRERLLKWEAANGN